MNFSAFGIQRESTIDDQMMNLREGIRVIQSQREHKSARFHGVGNSYQMEIATRLLLTEILLQKRDCQQAECQIFEIKLLAILDNPKHWEKTSERCSQLSDKIRKLQNEKMHKISY